MDWFLSIFICGLLVQVIVAPPVTKDKANEDHKEKESQPEMEYHRYLKEVVDALDSDPDFRAKLEKANEEDIRTGKIAHELEFVNHRVRTKLDELKREELERLRHLAIKESHLNNGIDLKHLKIAEHLDHTNSRSFEINDLKKLIAKTTEDLEEADRRRREQFKEYEMQKKFNEEQKLKGMNEQEKEQYMKHIQELKEKSKKHAPIHHPGSKGQLEDVWTEQDDMNSEDFDLKKFFYVHDVDNSGFWDQNEVKALFLKDLDKLYGKDAPITDPLEKEEEMERMREHVFNEADLNKDGLISYSEFLEQAKKPDFQEDPGWETLGEQEIFTKEEYEAYNKRVQEMLQKEHGNAPLHDQQYPPQHVPVLQQQVDSNQVNQQQYQYQGQPVQQQYNPQQIPVQQQNYQGQVPIQQQQQPHYQQMQQQHLDPHQYQGQMPQNGHIHGQVQSNQIPIQHQQIQQAQQIQQQQQYQPQQQQQHNNQIPQQQQQQQQNIQNTISQQQHVQNQIPSVPEQNKENPVVQQSLPSAANSAQQIQPNSINNAGKA
ncbi:PREDICTED: nucleobindin-2-like isoform X2 [Polistes dominula]|nr:PREDICTED: nucleobindin-2-like isoform X2 [Polistes dominula]XP_015173583.1 PREDICTED: nucleobindin-2-like isoform X2 [Polistes dominula]